jgi:hypothetical protein
VALTPAYCDANNLNDYKWTFQNGGSRQGHPNGTLQLQYTNMLEPTQGYSFKPKAVLQAYLDGVTDIWGYGFVGVALRKQLRSIGCGNAYQDGDVIYAYCETTVRAMVTGFAAAAILGKPVRFYDGAMTEWNSLSYAQASDGLYILPKIRRGDLKRTPSSVGLGIRWSIYVPYSVTQVRGPSQMPMVLPIRLRLKIRPTRAWFPAVVAVVVVVKARLPARVADV